jgi:hypothetical protein
VKKRTLAQGDQIQTCQGVAASQPTCGGEKRQKNRNSAPSQTHAGEHAEENAERTARRKRTGFKLTGIGSAVLKCNLRTFHGTTVVNSKQAAIADGNAVDIGSQILEGSLTITNRLAMNNPILHPDPGRDLVKEFQFLQTAPEGSPK